MQAMQNPSYSPDAAAAVDLGTESALLLIARRGSDGALEVLEDHALSARLGAAVDAEGRLDPGPAERTLEVLGTFARRMDLAGVAPERRRLVATAAVRRLADPEGFARLVAERCGLELDLLDPEQEGRLGFEGAVPPAERERALLVDLGGGSIEVVLDGGERVESLPLGALEGALAFWGLDGRAPLETGGLAGWRSRVEARLSEHAGLRDLGVGRNAVLIGGTASNLACLEAAAETYDPRLAEGAEVGTRAAREWAERLDQLPLEERLDLGIEPSRAGLLPAGLEALGLVLEWLGVERGRVTGRGLRFAVVERALEAGSGTPGRRG